jgi:hypothetical protein
MYKQIASLLFSVLIVSAGSIHGMKRSSTYTIEELREMEKSSAYDIEKLRETRVPSMIYPSEFAVTNAIQLPPMNYHGFPSHNKKRRIDNTADLVENEIYHVYSSEIQQTEPRGFHIPEESEKVKLPKKKTAPKEKAAPKKRTKPAKPVYVKQIYPCDIEGCIYQAANGERLKAHKLLHESGAHAVCSICHFIAGNNYKYERHMRSHSDVSERGFQCSFCKKHLSCGDRLQSHILICKKSPDKVTTNSI